MKPLVFDTSVWVDHLRTSCLDEVWPRLRGRYRVGMDAFVAAELVAGCRSRNERRALEEMVLPFRRSGRLHCPNASDLSRAGRALSQLRERGVQLSNGAGAMVDAVIGVTAIKVGALLVTANTRDFGKLAGVLPLRWETLKGLSERLAAEDQR